MRSYALFERFGIELEYMVVDVQTLDVRPAVDQLFFDATGSFVSDVERGPVTWSNELVSHVVELKVTDPVSDLFSIEDALYQNVLEIEKLLSSKGLGLLPGGIHPWMDPTKETVLWKHEGHEIYERYHDIFDCHRHGWANVQSTHLNISFKTDEEFERLHAAIRMVLPLIPALTASSPVANAQMTGLKDTRLDYYQTNQERLPALAGRVIPEPVFSEEAYEQVIFSQIQKQIAPYNADHLLNQYFLNSRGAIARFDRGSVEIRLVDIQECVHADVAFLSLIIEVVKELAGRKQVQIEELKSWGVEDLFSVFQGTIREAGACKLDSGYARVFGLNKEDLTAKDLWEYLIKQHGFERYHDVYQMYLDQGTLADRLLQRLPPQPQKRELKNVYLSLRQCLLSNRLFL
ncbi:glutamate--cysteine ligase [Candidatus Uhrbacteria bacterium]|nr:glutamate--cysteine ligase [Candidatus Uhrbacteria bacterium]